MRIIILLYTLNLQIYSRFAGYQETLNVILNGYGRLITDRELELCYQFCQADSCLHFPKAHSDTVSRPITKWQPLHGITILYSFGCKVIGIKTLGIRIQFLIAVHGTRGNKYIHSLLDHIIWVTRNNKVFQTFTIQNRQYSPEA